MTEQSNTKSPNIKDLLSGDAQLTPEQLLRLRGAIEKLQNDFAPVLATFGEMVRGIGQQFGQLLVQLQPTIEWAKTIDWVGLKELMDGLPERSKRVMVLAAQRGWFFGWDDSLEDVVKLIDSLETAEPEAIDEVLMTYYRDNLTQQAERLMALYGERAEAISAATESHLRGSTAGYLLSIPVFTAQTDGILTDLTGVPSAFIRVGTAREMAGPKRIRELLKDSPSDQDLVHPLIVLESFPLFRSTRQRNEIAAGQPNQTFDDLNRHQIMHGEKSDYGSEINSLKAFSFLAFVGLHLPTVLPAAPAANS